MKAGGGRAARGRTVAPLHGVRAGGEIVPQHGAARTAPIVKGHASRAHHAPTSRRRAFGGDIPEEEIAKGEPPTKVVVFGLFRP